MSTALLGGKKTLIKQRLTLSRSVKYHRVHPEARRHRSPLATVSLATRGTCELSSTLCTPTFHGQMVTATQPCRSYEDKGSKHAENGNCAFNFL